MTTAIDWLMLAVLFACVWLAWRWFQHPRSHPGVVSKTVRRLLRPRTPDDCPACRQQPSRSIVRGLTRPPPGHSRAVKSRHGAPKRIATAGFACPTYTCAYYGTTDAQIHAFVGDGTHSQTEGIQAFRCQACRTTFTARRNTCAGYVSHPAWTG